MKPPFRIPVALFLAGAMTLSAGTRLSKAVIRNDLPLIQACLDDGEKVDELDKWGWTPLMWSVFYQQAPLTRLLLEKGANPNLPSGDSYRSNPIGSTALTVAANQGMVEEAAALIAKGGDPALKDGKGRSALDYATLNKDTDMLDVLKGKPWIVPPPEPDFGPGVDVSPLPRLFTQIQVAPFTTPQPVDKDYPGVVPQCQGQLLEALAKKKPFEKTELTTAGSAPTEATLLVRVDITGVRIPSGAARFFVGPLAGHSSIHAEVSLVEASTGKVLRTVALASENSVLTSSLTLGAHDQDLPTYLGELITDYLIKVNRKA